MSECLALDTRFFVSYDCFVKNTRFSSDRKSKTDSDGTRLAVSHDQGCRDGKYLREERRTSNEKDEAYEYHDYSSYAGRRFFTGCSR